METVELIALLAGIAALILGGIAYQRSGRPWTVQGMTETLEASRPLANEIRETAEVVVSGIQQLKETGKIQTNDEAFREAMKHLRGWFPQVEPERLVPFIEDAYRGVKLGTELMRAQHGVPSPTPEADLLDRILREGGGDA
jgi:hypothetical protein